MAEKLIDPKTASGDSLNNESLSEVAEQIRNIGIEESVKVTNSRFAKLFAAFVIIGIAFSRVYLGVHSISQVVMGSLLAWAVFEFLQFLRGPIVGAMKRSKQSR